MILYLYCAEVFYHDVYTHTLLHTSPPNFRYKMRLKIKIVPIHMILIVHLKTKTKTTKS